VAFARSGIRTIRGFPDPDAARAPETGAKSEFRIRQRMSPRRGVEASVIALRRASPPGDPKFGESAAFRIPMPRAIRKQAQSPNSGSANA
jgi:hypothetical protein